MHSKISSDCQDHQSGNIPVSLTRSKSLFTFFRSNLFKSFVKLGLTAFFVILVNRNLKQNDLKLIIGQIDLFWVLVGLVFGGLSFYFQLVRWQQILKSQSLPYHIRIAAKSMLIGFFLAFLTPGRIGEFFRGVAIYANQRTVSILAVIIERFYGVFLTVFFGIISVIIQFISFNTGTTLYFEILLIISFLLFCLAGPILRIISGKIAEIKALRPLSDITELFTSRLHTLPSVRLIFFSALSHLCLILQTAVLLGMYGSGNFLKNCLVAGQSYALMLFMPFFVANIGVRELSFSVFLKKLEAAPQPAAIAFGVSGLILLINIILPAILGLIWMLKGNRSREDLSEKEYVSTIKVE